MREVKLPEPAAWTVGATLTWVAAPERSPHAYSHAELRRFNLDGEDYLAPIFTADQLRQAVQEAVEAERERAAKVCEGLRDLREEARAILKASAALSEGDAAETLRRLRHESDVRLHNGALDRAAAAIRSGA
jgi:hypothetical protein